MDGGIHSKPEDRRSLVHADDGRPCTVTAILVVLADHGSRSTDVRSGDDLVLTCLPSGETLRVQNHFRYVSWGVGRRDQLAD